MSLHSARTIAGNAGFNFVRQVVVFGLGLVTSVILARSFGPETMGSYAQVLWLAGLLGLLVSPGLVQSVGRYVAEAAGTGETSRVSAVIRFFVLLQLLLLLPLAAVLLFGDAVARSFSIAGGQLYVILAVVGLVPGLLAYILSAVLGGLLRFKYAAIADIAASLALFGLTILALVSRRGLTGTLVAVAMANVVSLLLNATFLGRNGVRVWGSGLQPVYRNRLIRFTLNMGLLRIVEAVRWQRLEVFFLGKFSPSEEIAFYSLGHNLAIMSMTVSVGSLMGVLVPLLTGMHSRQDQARVDRVFVLASRYVAILAFWICAGALALARPAIQLLYGQEYNLAASVLAIIIVGTAASQVGWVAAGVLQAVERADVLLRFSLAAAGLNVLCNALLTPQYHSLGASIANTTVQVLSAIALIVYVCLKRRTRYPVRSLLRTVLASGTVAWLARLTIAPIDGWAGLFVGVMLVLVMYPLLLLILRVIEAYDLALLGELSPHLGFLARSRLLLCLCRPVQEPCEGFKDVP